MALFRFTTKRSKRCNGIYVEAGMSVQVPAPGSLSPLAVDGGKRVAEAFTRVYGIDLKQAGCLNVGDLLVERIG